MLMLQPVARLCLGLRPTRLFPQFACRTRAHCFGILPLAGTASCPFRKHHHFCSAAPLALLQVHGQPVDPNLKLLAESYQLVAQKMSAIEAGQEPDIGAGAAEEGEQAAQQADDDNPDLEADPADGMLQVNGAHADASDSDADVRLSRHKAKKRRSILH